MSEAPTSSHSAGPADQRPLLVRELGRLDYAPVYAAMRRFTDRRQPGAMDEIWLLEHPPVYTLGMNGKPEHVLNAGAIPVLRVDRGGQVTYHGPGQLVVYLLLELRRSGLGVRSLVTLMEQSLIELVGGWGVSSHARPEAPGVYVGERKIASLGLRIRRGYSYHGLALNVDMDLEPFRRINPCGYPGLVLTQLHELAPAASVGECSRRLLEILRRRLGYTVALWQQGLPAADSEPAASASEPTSQGEQQHA